MQQIRMTSTDTLAQAMYLLSQQIQSPDGIANAAILEAAQRLVILDSLCKAAAEVVDLGARPEDSVMKNLIARLRGKVRLEPCYAHVPEECEHILKG